MRRSVDREVLPLQRIFFVGLVSPFAVAVAAGFFFVGLAAPFTVAVVAGFFSVGLLPPFLLDDLYPPCSPPRSRGGRAPFPSSEGGIGGGECLPISRLVSPLSLPVAVAATPFFCCWLGSWTLSVWSILSMTSSYDLTTFGSGFWEPCSSL